MWWTDPLWLIALLLLIPMALLGSGRPLAFWRRARNTGRSEPWKAASAQGTPQREQPASRRLTILRLAAVTVTILALAGSSIPLPGRARHAVLLLDVSDSLDKAEIERERRTALAILDRLHAPDTAALIAFAGDPLVLTQPVEPREAATILETAALSAPRPQETDLETAIRTADELLSRQGGNRFVVLISDGRPNTQGRFEIDPTEIGGVPVYAVPAGNTGGDLVTRELKIPDTLNADEPVPAEWSMSSDRTRNVTVVERLDGLVARTFNLAVPAGLSTVPLVISNQEAGIHRLELEVAGEDGEPLPLASSGALLCVGGPAGVLVVTGDGSESPLTSTLQTQGMLVRERASSELPENTSGLSGYAAVILDNVPAFYMTESQQQALAGYVLGGGGLLVVGGESSLGRGEYYASLLEGILPVQTDTRQRLSFTRASILFIIDHSGSMEAQVGSVSKQQAAMRGVAAAIEELNPLDEVGIMAFDVQPDWILPFTPAEMKEEILQALGHIGTGGGTDMTTALQEAAKGFSDRGPVRKHVVILTDGQTLGSQFEELSLQLGATGATITTIGVGEDVNEDLLKEIAAWGNGEYYRAQLDQIPDILVKETVRITRDLIQEGDFTPSVRESGDFLQGLGQTLPAVKGYLVTKPKQLANVYLGIGDEGDPLLASWRYGNGRSTVFTSDSGRRWLSAWSGLPVYNRFWSQLVRSIARGVPEEGLHLSGTIEGGAIHLVVEAVDADGRLRSGMQLMARTGDDMGTACRLTETAPGYYEAAIPLTGSGLLEYEVSEEGSGAWTIGGVWQPPSGELQALGPDAALLSHLASVTDGGVLDPADPEIPGSKWSWEPTRVDEWLILLALLLFVTELGYRSIYLGQGTMAMAALHVWWRSQAGLIEKAGGAKHPKNLSNAGYALRRATEAHRYLAERLRMRRK